MLRLSTKGRYGTRLMLYLALNYGKGIILLRDIARHEKISRGYLEQLVPFLRAAKLIQSTRGAHGGYTLAKEPLKITLGEIVQALEGSLSPVECLETPASCNKVDSCITREIWKELEEKISKTLESVTLKDMAAKYHKKQQGSLVYQI